jgi:hypothetical protein
MRQATRADFEAPETRRSEVPGRPAVPSVQGLNRSRKGDDEANGRDWLREPRTAVLIVLGGVVLIGGSRRLLQAWQARKAVARLGDADVKAEDVENVAAFGRAGLHELFRILGESTPAPIREAAGRSIASLWAQDQLIAEEEQALVRRGYSVTWNARRKYPRAMRLDIPIAVTYGLTFLSDKGPGIKPTNLEWSHRVMGARRAVLEDFSPWSPGPGDLDFTIVPGDFETEGPHRLVLQTRVRTAGLTDFWEIELPHIPFHFEFDPRLDVGSLLTLLDDDRGGTIGHSLSLQSSPEAEGGSGRFLALNEELTIRNPPRIAILGTLPCDLAHRVWIEFEGLDGRFPAGKLMVQGRSGARELEPSAPLHTRAFMIGPRAEVSRAVLDRPGRRTMRVILTADPELGWTDPEVRSLWPGTIETRWVEVEIVRR